MFLFEVPSASLDGAEKVLKRCFRGRCEVLEQKRLKKKKQRICAKKCRVHFLVKQDAEQKNGRDENERREIDMISLTDNL